MENTKYTLLRTNCYEALVVDNLEKCLEILAENLLNNKEVIAYQGALQGLLRDNRRSLISRNEYRLERNQLRAALIDFVSILKDEATIEDTERAAVETKERIEKVGEEIKERMGKAIVETSNRSEKVEISMLNGIHDRILVVKCKESPTDWERIFPDTRYSHIEFMTYGQQTPREFINPDVVIFDDLDCPGLLGNRENIKQLSIEFSLSHLLYVGAKNPFQDSKPKDEQAIFARMGNANSRITVPGRLNELLEFRKNYGPPLSTIILENMKDKLPLKVFISYSHRDEDWKNDLDMHLSTMKRQGLIDVWQDRKIAPGAEWDDEIKKRLEASHLVLILLSPGFQASDYIQDDEVPRALSLHAAGQAKVVPIFVKHVEWKDAIYGKLQGLPRDEKFLDTFPNRDQGLATVAKELRELVENWGK